MLGSRQWRYCDYESVCIVYCLPSDPRLSAGPPPMLFNDIGSLTCFVVVLDARGRGCGCTRTRSRLALSRIFATGGIRTTDQIFAEVVLLLGKTTRLVSPREGTSRVVFPNKRTTPAKIWSVVRIPPVAKILDKASRGRVLVHPQPRQRKSGALCH